MTTGTKAKRAGLAICAAALLLWGAVAVFEGGGASARPPASLRPASFDWLRAGAAPRSWPRWRLPEGPARLPEPPGWQRERGDPGTRTVVLGGASGGIAGYLNATPQEGAETLRNWSAFRIEHNRDEGDSEVELLAAARRLRFRGGTGSCVLDDYRTSSGHRYREIACLVAGRSATTVIVAAAPPRRWSRMSPTLERAIEAFTT